MRRYPTDTDKPPAGDKDSDPTTTTALSPTVRTSVRRGKTRGVTERDRLHTFLEEVLLAHIGVITGTGSDMYPLVLSTAFGIDLMLGPNFPRF